MRITFVLPFAGRSGGIRVLAIYAQALQARGHRVSVISFPPYRPKLRDMARGLLRGSLPRREDEQGSHFDGLDIPHRVLERFRDVEDGDLPDADAVVATWWETAPGVASLSACKGAKLYFLQHDEVVFYGAEDRTMRERVLDTMRLPMRKVAVAQWIADAIGARGITEPIHVVPNGVDTEKFNAPARKKQAVLTVGMMYSATDFKASSVGFEAVARARRALPGVRFVAFGVDRPTRAESAALDGGFERTPAHERMRAMYAGCDAWLFTSRCEGFGLPILEAMACRTPVIGTRTGAAPDLLPGGGGELVAIDDAAAMGDAIVRFGKMSEEEWSRRSESARRAAEACAWARSIEQFESQIVAAARMPSPALT
jgi:glycosyltransferase involved in cell wall biosynthesis